MSKRKSFGQKTLLNYFTSPIVSNKSNCSISEDNLKDDTPKKTKNVKRSLEKNSAKSPEISNPRKRIKYVKDSSDSENDTPVKTPVNSKSAEQIISEFANEKNSTPEEANDSEPNGQSQTNDKEDIVWFHNTLEFLQPTHIRDKKRRRPSDPDYDKRTLYVPNDFLDKQTPAMRQWWLMKSDYFDPILFFKVGKFYELYHMDAEIGVNVLGICYMKGDFAHTGFPESAYGRMTDLLIESGYKVARIEQMETPEMLADRNKLKKNVTKYDKVVRRELCQITDRATRVLGLQNIESNFSRPAYLVAVCENKIKNGYEYGICFIDTLIGVFHLGQFVDDIFHSKLLTFFAQYPPELVLIERKKMDEKTKQLLKTYLDSDSVEELFPISQFYDVQKTIDVLLNQNYFKDDNNKVKVPKSLKQFIEHCDSANASCKEEFRLSLQSLGACIWYLKECRIDIQLITLGKFEIYDPMEEVDGTKKFKNESQPRSMILDAVTLNNLMVLGPQNSLQSKFDYCCTSFGRRLLHQWLCRPSCDINVIKERQNAISELLNKNALVQQTKEILIVLPNLESLIVRIHTMGNLVRAKEHPDNRAVFYEERTYSRRIVRDFIITLRGFEKAMELMDSLSGVESSLLKQITSTEGMFPDLRKSIIFFKKSLDQDEAQKTGVIIPQHGMDEEYDAVIDEIEDINKRLNEYLKVQKKKFNCEINYFGTDKKRFQLDIPEHAASKVPNGYYLEGAKKGSKPTKRYSTDETKKMLADMIAAETKSKLVLRDLNRRIFEKFSAEHDDWSRACNCLAVLDVLLSLAEYVKNQSTTICVPEVLPFSDKSSLHIVDGIHPCIENVENFVPNDTDLGKTKSPLMILTGPNMGGKSTLMRQVALLTITAQIGCHVPAKKFEFTLVDRIFTRLGSNDNIMTSHSTFRVELHEASVILKNATTKSLVLVDELGRGTATYDGTAIATTYVDRLIRLKCRTIFSTHYYTLLKYYQGCEFTQLGHMACKVEEDEDSVTQENILFMYKLIPGACPKSFGFNAAFLAGIPHKVTKRSSQVAQLIEAESMRRQLFRKICTNKAVD